MAPGRVLLLLGALLLAYPSAALADDRDSSENGNEPDGDRTSEVTHVLRAGLEPGVLVLEVSMGIAGSVVGRGPHVLESDGTPLGVTAAFTAGYRSHFLATAALDFAYYGLGGSTDLVRTGDGRQTQVENTMQLSAITAGLLVDLHRFRARGGLGAFHLALDSETGGVRAHTARWSLGYLFGIGGHFYRHEGRQLGAEARVAIDVSSDIVVLTLALTGTLDALRF